MLTMFIVFGLITSNAIADGLSGDVYVSGVSKYLWRGQDLYDNFALQPGFDFSLGSFSLGFWGSYHPELESFAEADFTLSYGTSLSVFDIGLGYTFYTFLQPEYSDSHEVFGSITYSGFLSPGVKLYYDFDDGDGLYAEVFASYGFKLGLDLSLSGSLGFNAGQWGYDSSLTVFGLGLGTSRLVGPIEISPLLFGQITLDDQYKYNDRSLNGFAGLTVKYNF